MCGIAVPHHVGRDISRDACEKGSFLDHELDAAPAVGGVRVLPLEDPFASLVGAVMDSFSFQSSIYLFDSILCLEILLVLK